MSVGRTRVSDLILRDGRALGVDELSAHASISSFSALRGQFAFELEAGDQHVLVRDPLGVNKLFFTVADDRVESANFFVDLVRRGHAPDRIWSVPSGHGVRIEPGEHRLELQKYSQLSFGDEAPEVDLAEHAARIRAALTRTFQSLSAVLAGRPVYVTLSGGLDSTTIAALSREHLGQVTAVTFVARTPGTPEDPDSDIHAARRVARELDLPLEVVEALPDELPDRVDEVLLYGQDFRDFNVHCGLVNAFLASEIGRREPLRRACVLSGDTMNELMADYTPVRYGSSEYYTLPNLGRGRLRRFLVSGLDSGDREVGIFAHHGVDLIQPYAIEPEAYTALPAGFLDDESAKQRLVRAVMGDRIPEFVYTRPKVRAQVAGSNKVGGTMAALLDRGIDSAALERRFCQLLGFDSAELKRWIRAGVYRFTHSYPEVA
jgi:asparagine synthetase B (glutamine-hydrolysing)